MNEPKDLLSSINLQMEPVDLSEHQKKEKDLLDQMHSFLPPLDESIKLDPGVDQLVRRLRSYNFLTIDSGDGRSKPVDERSFGDRAHVVIRVEPKFLLKEVHRLYGLLESWMDHPSIYRMRTDRELPAWECDASYNPRDGVAMLFVWDVTDDMLDVERKRLIY